MLYLEDILEVIENVPQEVRDRTTELRELDLGIQNAQDQLEDQIKSFFSTAKKIKPQERDSVYEKIRKEYYKLLDDADEKVNVATNMHDSLERYTRKLDQELEKFKYELEADSPGITEILEKRSLELDEPIKESQKENRYRHLANSRSSSSSSDWRTAAATAPSSSLSIKKEELFESQLGPNMAASPPATSLSYTLGQIGAGSNAIAAAASQAIAATQQLQQGRRTASLKASYDAITHGVHPTEFSIGSELANAAQTALAASALPQDQHSSSSGSSSGGIVAVATAAVPHATATASAACGNAINVTGITGASGTSSGLSSSNKTSSIGTISANKRQKKKHLNTNGANTANANSNSSTSSSSAAAPSTIIDSGILPASSSTAAEESLADPTSLESPDWTYDPNEPRYCVCNQVSYGDMVACDNPRCPVEWFHYPCVGINAPPKGKWYCPQCSASMNRRQRK